jgi:phage shock protein A
MASGIPIIDKLTRLLGTAIDDAVRSVDDPERLLQQLVLEMTRDLVDAKNHLAQCKKEERRLAKEVEILDRTAQDWEKRATAAVRAGDDVVATDALVRKRQNDEHADKLRGLLDRQRQDTKNLTNALIGLNLRIEEAKHKKGAILLQARRAQVEGTIAEVIHQSPGDEPSAVLDRLGRRVSLLEGQAGLLPELSDEAIAAHAEARVVPQPPRKPRKPLAKTRARDATRGRGSPHERANAAGQKRTKR